MVRPSNQSQGDGPPAPQRPSGTDNFGNLFRDPTAAINELLPAHLERRGFGDLRPALLAVGQHVRAEGSRITELAERAMLTKATVVYLVDELEGLGYVRREPDPADGRAKLVIPTERARAAEAAARDGMAEIRDHWAKLIGEKSMSRLEAGLRDLRAALWPSE